MVARSFLCHASEDKPQVENLYNRLRKLGFEPWMDKKDLIPGQHWRREIPRVLKASALVLVCLSQKIGRPGYVQREFKLAVDVLQDIPEDMIHTIPVLLEPCSVPEQFADLHWCPLFEPDGFDRLLVAIHYAFQQRGEPLPAQLESWAELLPSFTNSIGMEFILIPAGEFTMGSPDWDPNASDNEKPAHQGTISQDFYLGKYPVTQGLCVGQNRWRGTPSQTPKVGSKDLAIDFGTAVISGLPGLVRHVSRSNLVSRAIPYRVETEEVS